MLKKRYIALLAGTFATVLGQQTITEQPVRELISIFDTVEQLNTYESCAVQATHALDQKAAPLLVGKNTLYNAIKGMDFAFEDWIIRRVSEHFVLLIPKRYLKDKGITSIPASKTEEDPVSITEFELDMGLRIDHLPILSDKKIFLEYILQPTSTSKIHGLALAKEEFYKIIDGKDALFLTQARYKGNHHKIPAWNIYWKAHGGFGYIVAGLAQPELRVLLLFLNNFIRTKTLTLFSCYTQSNLQKAYQDLTQRNYLEDSETRSRYSEHWSEHWYRNILFNKQPEVTLKFTVIASSLMDNCVTTLGFGLSHNFLDFFKYLNNAPNSKHLTQACESLLALQHYSGNMPTIKIAGQKWNKILDASNVITIDSIMGSVRNKPLHIGDPKKSSFPHKKLGRAKEMIIALYAQQIKTPLVIDKNGEDCCFVSMLPENEKNRIHYIETLDAQSMNLDTLYKAFFKLDDQNTFSNYAIKKVTLKDDNKIFNVHIVHESLLFSTGNGEHYRYSVSNPNGKTFDRISTKPGMPQCNDSSQLLTTTKKLENLTKEHIEYIKTAGQEPNTSTPKRIELLKQSQKLAALRTLPHSRL